jgi:hypothetical protein
MKKGPKPALTDKSVVAQSVVAQVTFLSSDDEFTPAALVDDVSGAPSPGGMKQIVSDPFAGEELSPLAPRFAFQTLFEHAGSNLLQFVFSGCSILISALKAERFHRSARQKKIGNAKCK